MSDPVSHAHSWGGSRKALISSGVKEFGHSVTILNVNKAVGKDDFYMKMKILKVYFETNASIRFYF